MIDIIAAAIGKTIPGYDGAIPGDSIMASTLRDAARAVLDEFTKHDGIAEVIPPHDYKALIAYRQMKALETIANHICNEQSDKKQNTESTEDDVLIDLENLLRKHGFSLNS